MRKIAIFGRSYCGSTLLSRLLNLVPGVASVGELHWFVDRPDNLVCCSRCGLDCPVFTEPFIRKRFDQSTLYDTVGKQAGADTLVSADKVMVNYRRFLSTGEADAIILFRRPEAILASDIKHGSEKAEDLHNQYVHWYTVELNVARQFFRDLVFVSFDRFVTDPAVGLRAVSAALNLSRPRLRGGRLPPLRSIASHSVGGNGRAFSESIDRTEEWRKLLTAGQKQMVKDHAASQVWADLLARSCV